MLRLAKLADYGLVISAALADMGPERVKLEQVAERSGVPVPTVRKIMKLLVDAGLVKSERGIHGGYLLARPAGQISLAEVVQAVEGGMALTECCREDNLCDVASSCTVQSNWSVVNHTVQTLFNRITLMDMTRRLTPEDLIAKLHPARLELVSLDS